jgi:hypothetical protein
VKKGYGLASGLTRDHINWVHPRSPRFFLPKDVLSEVFRGKFLEGLRQAHASGQLGFHGMLQGWSHPRLFRNLIRQLRASRWVVYCKPPFGGPEQVLRYLGAYTHRVAISNRRLVSFQDDQVTFRWRDSAHKNKKRLLRLPVDEFLRRFLLHVLPRGFVRIRHFGFLASRRRGKFLSRCRQALASDECSTDCAAVHSHDQKDHRAPWTCPHCGGTMMVIERLTQAQIRLRSPPAAVAA